jgi:hypothetical protein
VDAKRGFRKHRPFTRGDTITIDFDLRDPFSGQAPDVGSSQVWFTIKANLADADLNAVFQGTILSADITPLGGPRVRVTVPATVTAMACLDGKTRLYYDLQVSYAGRVWTQEKGIFVIDPDVTRATS